MVPKILKRVNSSFKNIIAKNVATKGYVDVKGTIWEAFLALRSEK